MRVQEPLPTAEWECLLLSSAGRPAAHLLGAADENLDHLEEQLLRGG